MKKAYWKKLQKAAAKIGATIEFSKESLEEVITFTWQRKYKADNEERCYTEQQRLYILPATKKDRQDTGIKKLAGVFDEYGLEHCWTHKHEANLIRGCLRVCNYISDDEYNYAYDYMRRNVK